MTPNRPRVAAVANAISQPANAHLRSPHSDPNGERHEGPVTKAPRGRSCTPARAAVRCPGGAARLRTGIDRIWPKTRCRVASSAAFSPEQRSQRCGHPHTVLFSRQAQMHGSAPPRCVTGAGFASILVSNESGGRPKWRLSIERSPLSSGARAFRVRIWRRPLRFTQD